MFVRLPMLARPLSINCRQSVNCKREELGSKAIQQNEFYGMSDTNSQICTKLKKTKKKKKKKINNRIL